MPFRKFHHLRPDDWIHFQNGPVLRTGKVLAIRTRKKDAMPMVAVSYWNGRAQMKTEIDQTQYRGFIEGPARVSLYKSQG